MSKYTFLAFTNPTPGKEHEFNTWYDEHHLKEMSSTFRVSCLRDDSAWPTRNSHSTPANLACGIWRCTNSIQMTSLLR